MRGFKPAFNCRLIAIPNRANLMAGQADDVKTYNLHHD
jgi:hypothetical protein